MNQTRRILLIGQAAQHRSAALQRAVALAKAAGAPLHIAVLLEPFLTYSILAGEVREQIRQSLLNEQRRYWDQEIETLGRQGIQVTCSIAWAEKLHEEILCHVREIQPLMLIKDVRHEPLLKRAFVTPLDWHLLRDCPAPLHLVSDARHAQPKVVVVAVDLSDSEAQCSSLNDQLVATGIDLARQCGADLRLLYVHDNRPGYLVGSGAPPTGWTEIAEELRAVLHRAFVDLAERHEVPRERRHFILGQPATGIIQFARERQADVVVMGRAQRAIPEKWLGSTTEAVLYRVSGSILAIRPGDG